MQFALSMVSISIYDKMIVGINNFTDNEDIISLYVLWQPLTFNPIYFGHFHITIIFVTASNTVYAVYVPTP